MEVMEERLRQMRRHRLELQRMRDRLAVLIDEAEAYERGGFIRENFERAKGALYGAQFAIGTEVGVLEDIGTSPRPLGGGGIRVKVQQTCEADRSCE